MKSKNFVSRSHKTVLRGNREKPVPKQTNWDRIVYLIILVIILIVIGTWTFSNFFMVYGHGYISTPTLTLRAPDGIKITGLYAQPKEFVNKGDSLFSFENFDKEDLNVQIQNDIVDWKEDIEGIEREAYLIRERLKNLRKKLTFYKNEKEKIQNKIRLDIANINDLNQVERKLFDIKQEIDELKAELRVLYQKKNELESKVSGVNNGNESFFNDNGGAVFLSPYRSPVEGKVSEIFIRPHEVIFGEEPLMSIILKKGEPFIIGKFYRKDAEYLAPGAKMEVNFNNGSESEAVVKGYFSGKFNSRWKEWIDALKEEDYIVVKLVPINKEEAKKWKEYQGIGVELSRLVL